MSGEKSIMESVLIAIVCLFCAVLITRILDYILKNMQDMKKEQDETER